MHGSLLGGNVRKVVLFVKKGHYFFPILSFVVSFRYRSVLALFHFSWCGFPVLFSVFSSGRISVKEILVLIIEECWFCYFSVLILLK